MLTRCSYVSFFHALIKFTDENALHWWNREKPGSPASITLLIIITYFLESNQIIYSHVGISYCHRYCILNHTLMQKAQSEVANAAIQLSMALIIGDMNQVWSSTYWCLKYEDKLLMDTAPTLYQGHCLISGNAQPTDRPDFFCRTLRPLGIGLVGT